METKYTQKYKQALARSTYKWIWVLWYEYDASWCHHKAWYKNIGKYIDNIITTIHPSRVCTDIVNTGFSDHFGICLYTRPIPDEKAKASVKQPINKKQVRCISDPNIKHFASCLSEMNWLGIYCIHGVEDQFCVFSNVLMEPIQHLQPIYNLCFPFNSVKIELSSYWLNNVNICYTADLFKLKEECNKFIS